MEARNNSTNAAAQLARLNQLRAEGLVAEGVYTPMKAYYERQARHARTRRIPSITNPRKSR